MLPMEELGGDTQCRPVPGPVDCHCVEDAHSPDSCHQHGGDKSPWVLWLSGLACKCD